MSKVLIVHAHHEPQSFSSSMAKTAAGALKAQGHEVVFSDLHAMGFQPVSDRRNFRTTADASYLKQQQEEAFATEHGGFAPEVEDEIRKLEACDLLVFSFPLWWFGMPAILKGWVDRVFAYKRIYSRGKWYENGVGHGKRALVLLTTGGSAAKYSPGGLHGTIENVLSPVHLGIFWFNGFSPLPPFVAWEAAHLSDAERGSILKNLELRMAGIFAEPVIELPRVAEFDPATAVDTVPRFMVTLRRNAQTESVSGSLRPEETEYLRDLHRQGKLLSLQVSSNTAKNAEWRCFLLMRERDVETVRTLCSPLTRGSLSISEITALETTAAV